jgi:HAE1 family hydrophobic/amphiphilic exporter-1
MGLVGIGGLAVSTLLTLLIVPVAYTLMDDAQTAVMRWVGKERSLPSAPPE